MPDDIEHLLGPEGPFARSLPRFRPRRQQIEMAQAIAEAIRDNACLIAEAGTGTGKTFAYLVPALLSGARVIIATGTKTLQDQLFDRDLPQVREALRLPVTVALLKGRSNYVCHYHLARTQAEGRLQSREQIQHLNRIAAFAQRSATGDRADCDNVPEGSPVWHWVTSTRDNCLGQDCPHQADCFVLKARREALAADVIVVNHHLFFADLALKDDGLGELLPAVNVIILDEAHRAAEAATQFFGERISAQQVLDYLRELEVVQRAVLPDALELLEAIQRVGLGVRELRACLPLSPGKLSFKDWQAQTEARAALNALQAALSELAEHLEGQAERDAALPTFLSRCEALRQSLSDWAEAREDDKIRWCELASNGWSLHSTPLSVAPLMRAQIEAQPRAWIFTSATLSAGGSFEHFQRQLGLEAASAQSWDSPFDYAQAGWIYVPENLPEPNSPQHTQAVIATALELIRLSRGRAFLLFTSLRAMRQCAETLPGLLAAAGLDYPVLMQNDAPKHELLRRFRASGQAVLIGSQSFWEGVDVAGDALSLVLIDKLPFAPPDDPVLAARLQRLEAEGGSPFMDWQLPQAALLLKQGAGRLIRSETDRGVLAICDARLISKSYGRILRKSLPPMPYTRELGEVRAFFAMAEAASTATAPATAIR